MRIFPGKRSWNWVWVCVIHALILFAAILASRAALHVQYVLRETASLAVLAVSLALIASAGGWMGGRLFFLFSALGTLAGAGYMLIISLAGSVTGWEDLASVVGFVFLSAIGIGVGLLAELIRFFITRKKRDRKG